MKIVPVDKLPNFTVRYLEKGLFRGISTQDEDMIEVSYNNYEYALEGHPSEFETILRKLMEEIKKGQAA